VNNFSNRPSIRVAHVLPHYPGRDGSAAFCRGLSRALNRLVPGSCAIYSFRPDGQIGDGTDEVLHYQRSRALNPFHVPKAFLDDIAANKHELDGMILHGTYNPPMAVIASHLRKIGMPYIFIPHDPYIAALRQHHRLRKSVYWRLYERKVIKGAAAIQLLDVSHEKPLRDLGYTGRTEVIPNGCEPEMLTDVPAEVRTPGAEETIKLLYFGRMDRNHKGLDLLLEGYAKARMRSPDLMEKVELVLTGNDWTDRQLLERLARRLGIESSVIFTGRREETAMEIVCEADLVLLPSRFDGFGLCIVEAMLAGRPVIASSGAGVATHVEESGGGFVIEPSAEGVAAGIEKALMVRQSWPELGKKGHDYVLNHLTWDIVASQTLEFYRTSFQ
jgi:glycosyltransferase involved in cell wall biosynthesis